MELKEIQELLKLVNRTNLTEVEIEKKEFKIKIRRKSPESNVIYTTQQAPALAAAPVAAAPAAPAAPAPEAKAEAKKSAPAPKADSEPDTSNLVEFKSPMIGTFYRSPNPESPSYVNVGDRISKGQVVCIVEAMKLFNEIESEVEGKIVKIMVDNAQPVEYDQVLFLVDPNG
ncbi:acetyl-CoA carboxylase biotin carboxyl carrier protein [Pontibacter sp. G13]|uniref:acetyl-CoA carboxylase biotin carboxyl carrier protein n=1 Tax=Pontibacter sp. G13 TaxID=3074898 RepID=UPI00288A81DF|nr:acetyl-CoA carboxylase biotin carboxyl carrier protein [Pontibacter sp. G13]WNJ16470.1 acetyl-CoA carboxylase biotin carboxyl carrier protein [Pontibacter sp. G13]